MVQVTRVFNFGAYDIDVEFEIEQTPTSCSEFRIASAAFCFCKLSVYRKGNKPVNVHLDVKYILFVNREVKRTFVRATNFFPDFIRIP